MDEKQIRAADAQTLLDNPVYKGAVVALNNLLDNQMLGMDVDNQAQCARIVQAKQLVQAMTREIARFVAEGQVQDYVNLEDEREKRKDEPRKMQR